MLENQWMWTYLKKIAGTSNGERQKPTAQQYIVAVTGNTISTQSIKKTAGFINRQFTFTKPQRAKLLSD
jgi:hypothetical protein